MLAICFLIFTAIILMCLLSEIANHGDRSYNIVDPNPKCKICEGTGVMTIEGMYEAGLTPFIYEPTKEELEKMEDMGCVCTLTYGK